MVGIRSFPFGSRPIFRGKKLNFRWLLDSDLDTFHQKLNGIELLDSQVFSESVSSVGPTVGDLGAKMWPRPR